MKKKFVITFSILFTLFSCNTESTKEQTENIRCEKDTISSPIYMNSGNYRSIIEMVSKKIEPVVGYRFSITGDFDGDGKKENLVEHYVSGHDFKETNKFYENLSDYEQLINLTMQKKPISFVSSDNNSIDTLHIASRGGHFGLSFLKNEGDLNGDGTDEVSYVVNFADLSSWNTYIIMTYKNNKWIELYYFDIWDWLLPDLPETSSQYGICGLTQKMIISKNDELNKQIENELLNFEGLVKKIKTNKIQILCRNEESELDTIIVDL